MALAALIISAWTALHVYGVFFLEATLSIQLLLLIALQTWLSVGVYIVAHDAIHGSLWPADRVVGRRVGTLALWLYAGFHFRRIAIKHYAHHRHPGSASDPDFDTRAPARMLRWYGRLMRGYLGPAEIIGMLVRVGIYVALGARLQNIFLLFALPGLLSSFQLFYFGTYLPHRPATADAFGFGDRHRARSNEYGYLASLLSCFHFGYHHEHHAHPGMPWWRLPEARKP